MGSALNDVVVVSLDVRIWSGRRKLRPEDLTTSGRLPPKDLVSLGSKKLCDPKALKPFADVKRKAEARCAAIGVRFARAFAVPKTTAKPLVGELNALARRFEQVRDAFLATYNEELARWKAQHPGYEHLIDSELLAKAVVASKFVFGYEIFAINAVDGDDELEALLQERGGTDLGRGLAGSLYQEVASESRAFVRQSLVGRSEVTQRFLRPVRAIRDKLAGLAFLDAGIAPLVASIDEVLASVPRRGRIDGASLAALRGVVTLLTEPARMREHGRLMLEGSARGLLDAACSSADAELPPDAINTECDGETRAVPAPEPRQQRVSAFW